MWTRSTRCNISCSRRFLSLKSRHLYDECVRRNTGWHCFQTTATYLDESRGSWEQQEEMPLLGRLRTRERTLQRASSCLASLHNTGGWVDIWRGMSPRSRDLYSQNTITPRRPRGTSEQKRGQSSILCRRHTLVGSTWYGPEAILLGARGTRCGAWRSDPGTNVAPQVSHTPSSTCQSLHSKNTQYMAEEVRKGRRGQGWA